MRPLSELEQKAIEQEARKKIRLAVIEELEAKIGAIPMHVTGPKAQIRSLLAQMKKEG